MPFVITFICILQYLSQCVVGSSQEDVDEEEEDTASVDSGVIPPPKEGCYDVIGTIKDPNNKPPDCVKEIIKVIR